MIIHEVVTFQADIYVGFREHYTHTLHTYRELLETVSQFCNDNKLCVSTTQVDYSYVDGGEHGAKLTLINYPRFPSDEDTICESAIKLGSIIMRKFNQYRISIVAGDKTYMLEQEDTE